MEVTLQLLVALLRRNRTFMPSNVFQKKGVHDRLEIMVSRRRKIRFSQHCSEPYLFRTHRQMRFYFYREFDRSKLFQQSNQHDHRRKVIPNIVHQS